MNRRNFVLTAVAAAGLQLNTRAMAGVRVDEQQKDGLRMKPILALVGNAWADWELGFLFGVAGFFLKAPGKLATLGKTPAVSAGGLLCAADYDFGNIVIDDFAGLALIGSVSWLEPAGAIEEQLASTIRAAVSRGKVVGAIGSGTLGLARAGVLDLADHTSDAPDLITTHASNYRGSSYYKAVPHAVVSNSIVTAPGTAPVTFAIEMLKLAYPGNEEALSSLSKIAALEHIS